MPLVIGFTGSRRGLTEAQHSALSRWLRASYTTHAHHGCCVGADAAFAERLASLLVLCETHAWPSNLPHYVDAVARKTADILHDPLPPLDRNRAIVDACGILLACPDGPERLRSGTWATVRYARKQGKPVVIFWPDGRVEES